MTVNVKVISAKEPTTVADKSLQELMIGDSSRKVRLSLWQEQINSMEKGKSYCLKSFIVRDYQGTKYLTMPREEAKGVNN